MEFYQFRVEQKILKMKILKRKLTTNSLTFLLNNHMLSFLDIIQLKVPHSILAV